MAMGDVTTVNRYEKGGTIGSGTSRIVFKAIDKLTNRTVVVTMIRTGEYKESVNVTLLREIRLLKELHNPNVIELVDMYQHKRNLYLVFEYMESDLEAVIYDRNTFQSPADYKSYI